MVPKDPKESTADMPNNTLRNRFNINTSSKMEQVADGDKPMQQAPDIEQPCDSILETLKLVKASGTPSFGIASSPQDLFSQTNDDEEQLHF